MLSLCRERHVRRSVLVASSALFDVGGWTRLVIAPRFLTLSLFLPRLPRLPLVVVVAIVAVGVSADPAGIIAGIVRARLSFLVRAVAVIAIGREEEEGE